MCLKGLFLYSHRDKSPEISPDVLDEGMDSMRNGSDKGLRWMDLGEEDPPSQKAVGGGLCHAWKCVCGACLWDGNRQGETLWDYGCDLGLKGGYKTWLVLEWEGRVGGGGGGSRVLDPTLEEFHTQAATTLRGERWMSNNIVNRFPKTRTTGTWNNWQRMGMKMRKSVIFGPSWRQLRRPRVDDLLVALCSLALCPSSGFITTESVTADWHPDFNPYTSQLWWNRPLCQDGLRPPLCDAGGLQSCDLWSRKNTLLFFTILLLFLLCGSVLSICSFC